jgi:hypothetical protein
MSQRVIGSHTVSIGELLRSGSFSAAKVQRDYCWAEDQQRALLEELIALFAEFGFDPEKDDEEKPDAGAGRPAFLLGERTPDLEASAPYTFFGSVILYPIDGRFEIYDGLQRITTFTVLFAVLRDLIGKKDPDVWSLLVTDAGKFRLSMPMKHDTLDTDILATGRTLRPYKQIPTLTDPGLRLRECVELMRGMMDSWSPERVRAFANFVSDSVLVTVTTISDRRIAGKAFVTTNSAGVRLKPEEILKGQLIELGTTAPNPEEASERILWVWRFLQEDFGKERFDDFLRAVDFVERREYQSADFPILLMEHIRRTYSGEAGFRWATDRLLQYRSAYRWVHEAENEEVAVGVHASLRRLHMLKWKQWVGLAMLIHISSQPHEIAGRIDLLDRCCFGVNLAMSDPRRCAEVIGRRIDGVAKHGFTKKQLGFVFKKIQHEKIWRALTSPLQEGGRRGSIVRWIEASQHDDRVPRYIIDKGSSVEHVYPKNPGAHWTEFEAGLPFSEAAMLREMTGNLCILPRDELANAGWDEKRREYARFRVCRFASEIARLRTWSAEVIDARTQKLAEQTVRFMGLEVTPD